MKNIVQDFTTADKCGPKVKTDRVKIVNTILLSKAMDTKEDKEELFTSRKL